MRAIVTHINKENTMPYHGINWLAILVAGIVPMIVGALWYSPALFAKQWMAHIGKTEDDIKKNFNPAKTYGVTFIGALIMAYVVNYFVTYTSSTTFLLGMKIGFALWLGLVVTTSYASVTFEFKPKGLYYINMAYNFVCLVLMGGILAVWR
jgi:hypothetical protein